MVQCGFLVCVHLLNFRHIHLQKGIHGGQLKIKMVSLFVYNSTNMQTKSYLVMSSVRDMKVRYFEIGIRWRSHIKLFAKKQISHEAFHWWISHQTLHSCRWMLFQDQLRILEQHNKSCSMCLTSICVMSHFLNGVKKPTKLQLLSRNCTERKLTFEYKGIFAFLNENLS